MLDKKNQLHQKIYITSNEETTTNAVNFINNQSFFCIIFWRL